MKFADKKSLILLLPKILSSLFLVLVASFLFIAIITFSTFDPGWTYVASDTQQVSNLTGIVGAWFANVLRAFFGLASIWFPIILAYEAYQLWHAKKIITRLLRHFSQLFLILSSATLLALLRPSNTYTLDASGGILGYETAVAFSSLNLPSYLVMAIIFVFVLLFLSVAFAIQWSNAKNFFHQLRYNYHNIFYKYQSDAILIRENQKAQQRLAALQKQKTHSKQAEQTQMTIDEHVNHAAHSPDTVKINAENVYVSGDVWHQSSDGQASLQEMKQMLQELKQHSHAQRAEQNQVNTTTNTTNTTTETNTASKNQLNWSDDAAFDDLLQSAQQQSQAPTIHHTAFEQKHQQMSHRAAQATQLNQQIQQLNQQNQATQPSITESQTPTTKSIAPTQTTTSNKSVADLIHERLNQPSPLENVDQFLQQSEIQSDTTSQQPSHNDIKIVEPSIPAPAQNTVQNQQDDDFPSQQNHHSPTPLLYRNAVANPVAELQSDDLSNDDFNHDWHDDLDHQTTNVMPTSHSTHSTPQAVLHTPSQHNSTSHDFDLNHANDDVDSNTNSVMNETAQQDDDWDAPLTDSSGRIISRAMQVAEHRKTLSPLPSLDLLDPVDLTQKVQISEQELKQRAELLEIKLQDFNIKASVKEIHPGPVITRFELELAPGMKSSKVA
ncbi:MAG: DNA translocase FtsK 4TM domain-containing protein, partial [Acinetobacter sp.]|nr:DNA translocase FtsK 4TM domain-containing protein [Acinetobacter sp.]